MEKSRKNYFLAPPLSEGISFAIPNAILPIPKKRGKTNIQVNTSKSALKTSSTKGKENTLTFDLKQYPRVHSGLLLKELRDECTARQLPTKGKNTKNALLELLVDDTILLSQTNAFKEVEWIKEQMKNERSAKQGKAQVLIEGRRQKEKEKQTKAVEKKHTISCSISIHGCKLARAIDVGRPYSATCDLKRFNCRISSLYCCTKCNFDVCQSCFDFESLPEDAKNQKLHEYEEMRRQHEINRAKLEAERDKQRKAEEKKKEKEQAKFIARLEKFPEKIRKPKGANRDQAKLQDYVVWKSFGYDDDGWHTYQGSPEKEFDSSYATKKEANERVEYLFYVKNEWGLGADEILEMMEEEDIDRDVGPDGLLHLEVCPPDSDRWTVKAVPRAIFLVEAEESSSSEGSSKDEDDDSDNWSTD